MMFFTGLHQPSDAAHFSRSFVSVTRLWDRRGDFPAHEWIMDSGAFTELAQHGGYRAERSVRAYADQVNRWRRCGRMLRAVTQDYMCEPDMLARTGGTVALHQQWTTDRYLDLRALCGEIIMPCLQGQVPDDYVEHVRLYDEVLLPGAWVGVGSVCKRKNDSDIREVLRAIHSARPDLRLHGFGLKFSALQCAEVWDRLYSADSMAWSFAARKQGRNPNDWREAEKFRVNIELMPRQEVLL